VKSMLPTLYHAESTLFYHSLVDQIISYFKDNYNHALKSQ
jgi:hypothetical protein